MTAMTRTAPSRTRQMRDAVTSEWTKLRTVRSTWWILLITVVTALGGSVIVALSAASGAGAPFDPVVGTFIAWVEYPVLGLGVLGALAITNEYASGQIRTTFTALPQRLTVLAAKAAALGGLVLVVSELLAFCSFAITDLVLTASHRAVGIGHPGVLRAVACAGLTMVGIALLGLGLGVIIRHTAGAIIAVPAVLYLPLVLLAVPTSWGPHLGRFGMLAAAYQLVSPAPHATLLPLAFALLVLLAWPAVILAAAAFAVTRRDA